MRSMAGQQHNQQLQQQTQQLAQLAAQLTAQAADAKLRETQAHAKADLTALLAPLQTQLAQLNEHTHVLERNRAGAYEGLHTLIGTLKESQQALQHETNTLVRALRTPNVRGRWGEMQLKNVIELAGMQPYADFTMQTTLSAADQTSEHNNVQRPDVIVRLPGGASIAVDAKTPLDAYLDMLNATDEPARAAAHARHAQHVRRHVKELTSKAYWARLPSPELVVLFLPADHFLQSALEADANLLDEALAANVLLATPATLIALLKAIAYGWRQEKLADNAARISQLGRELYGRLATLASHWQKVGNALFTASKAYNESVGTLESRVLATARKFEDLGAVERSADQPIALQVTPTDMPLPRSLTAPEFTNAAEALVDTQAADNEPLKKIG